MLWFARFIWNEMKYNNLISAVFYLWWLAITNLDNKQINNHVYNIIVHIYDLSFEGQPSRSSDLFQLFWDRWPEKCLNKEDAT